MSTIELVKHDLFSMLDCEASTVVHLTRILKQAVVWLTTIKSTGVTGGQSSCTFPLVLKGRSRAITIVHTQGNVLLSINYDLNTGYCHTCVTLCIIIEAHLNNTRDPFSLGLQDAANLMVVNDGVATVNQTEIQRYLHRQYNAQLQNKPASRAFLRAFALRVLRSGYRGIWIVQ